MKLTPRENLLMDAFVLELAPEPSLKMGEWLVMGEGKEIASISGGFSGPHGSVRIFHAADKPRILAYLKTIGVEFTANGEQKK